MLPSAKVAIITRTKDRPLLLKRCIESVLNQTYQDWIHIIVNDGGAADPIDALLAHHKEAYKDRFLFISHPVSKGMEAASNVGINACTSDSIAILDDDDSWHPDFLLKTVALLEQNPWPAVGAVVSHTKRIVEKIEGTQVREIRQDIMNASMKVVDVVRLCSSALFPPCSFLFRRILYQTVGPFDESFPVNGDWDFSMRAALESEILVLPEPLANYHLRPYADPAYTNTIMHQGDRHKIYRTRLVNKWVRLDYKAGRLGIGTLMAHASQTEGLARFGRLADRFVDRLVGLVKKNKLLNLFH